ncbi:hypothetical protein AMECASPLE_039226 [Ameca splendens]|uniref:Uncharacterized protein n=1 Tax=Ameca splendens TaxID=208324 RepID=A0ABV0YK76_9TELE
MLIEIDNRIRLALDEIKNVVTELNEIPIAAHVSEDEASLVNNHNEDQHGDFLNLIDQPLEDLNRPLPPDQNLNLIDQAIENLNTPSPPDSHQNPSTSHNADQHGGNFNQEVAVSSDQIGRDPPAVVEREGFNNHEIRRPYTILPPCPGNIPDLYKHHAYSH